MKVEFKPSTLKESRWQDYAVRFVFGGLITAIVGVIARHYGPSVGGLFLAFPAIFPASATLVARHEREKHGGEGAKRCGEKAAGADAIGAAMGSLGLLAFGAVIWGLGPRLAAWTVLCLAAIAWIVFSLTFWVIRQKM